MASPGVGFCVTVLSYGCVNRSLVGRAKSMLCLDYSYGFRLPSTTKHDGFTWCWISCYCFVLWLCGSKFGRAKSMLCRSKQRVHMYRDCETHTHTRIFRRSERLALCLCLRDAPSALRADGLRSHDEEEAEGVGDVAATHVAADWHGCLEATPAYAAQCVAARHEGHGRQSIETNRAFDVPSRLRAGFFVATVWRWLRRLLCRRRRWRRRRLLYRRRRAHGHGRRTWRRWRRRRGICRRGRAQRCPAARDDIKHPAAKVVDEPGLLAHSIEGSVVAASRTQQGLDSAGVRTARRVSMAYDAAADRALRHAVPRPQGSLEGCGRVRHVVAP
jgi:hypothetical protein